MDTTATKNVTLICPNLKCRKVLRVPEQHRGQHVRCHYCGLTFLVPQHRQIEQHASSPDDGKKSESK